MTKEELEGRDTIMAFVLFSFVILAALGLLIVV
jgi:hypothetical protein